MIVYLNGVRKDVLIFSGESEVLDETLDSASFSFIDNNPLPIAPMQRVEIVHENTPSTYFITISDSVEPYTPTSNLYKHEVVCAESTRALSKRMLRNSVFSQPPSQRVGKMAVCGLAGGAIVLHKQYTISTPIYDDENNSQFEPNGWFRKLSVPNNEKCSSAKIRITTQFFTGRIDGEQWQQAFCKRFSTFEQFALWGNVRTIFDTDGKLNLHYTDNQNNEQSEEITFPANIFNGEVDFPRIKELINQGAKEIYLKTTSNCPVYHKIRDGFPLDVDPDTDENHIIGFSVQFEIIAETYIHTAYSVLQEIKERAEQKHRVRKYASDGSYVWQEHSRGELFKLPQYGELYELLNNTITPNLTFTQCSVYEAVAEVFRLFDAIFTIDELGVLGITYFNEKTGTANPQVVAKNSSISEERYINGLMCYYQDARAKVSFPLGGAYGADKERVYSYLSTKGVGVPSESDHIFRTPSPIHDIVSVWQKTDFMMFIVISTIITIHDYDLDMTDYVYEQSIWDATLDVSSITPATPNVIKQMNTIVYSKGSDYLDLSFSYNDSFNFYKYNFINATKSALAFSLGRNVVGDPTNYPCVFPADQASPTTFVWTATRMRVEYHSVSNGVFKVESYANKYDGEMSVDQSSGSIDLGKAGLNLLGLSFKMGEPTLNVTHRSTTWEDRIQKGFVLTYQGEQWTANNCRYTCIGDDTYQGQISFVKNYNELSLNKKMLREKRLSSVSSELTQKSEDIITEFCYVYENQSDMNLANVTTCWNISVFAKAMAKSLNAIADLQTFNDVALFNTISGVANRLFIPSVRYGAGDLICYEMSYDDPMVAGIQAKGSSTGWWGSVEYFSKYAIYTDAQGYIDTITLTMAYNDVEDYTLDFPVLSPITPSEQAFNINQYQINKQPNEVFALNFQTAFIPYHPNKVIIGKAFIENNFFVNGVPTARKLVFYTSDTETYSVLDTKGKGSIVSASQQITYSDNGNYFSIAFGGTPIVGHASWAVCDENGNILFAVNSTNNVLYFSLRATRL